MFIGSGCWLAVPPALLGGGVISDLPEPGCLIIQGRSEMRRKYPAMLAACAMLGLSMIFDLGSFAQPIPSPPPIMPPSLPPSHSVDLMTVAGATALGAKWKVMEAKLVEVPAAPNAIPEYKTTHNIAPRANELEFDNFSWPEISADTLGARRGGGHVSFLWYRTLLTIPAENRGVRSGERGRCPDCPGR